MWTMLFCIKCIHVFMMSSQENKIGEQTKKVLSWWGNWSEKVKMASISWTAISMYGSALCYSISSAGFEHLCSSCSSLNTMFNLKLNVCVCLFQSLLWLAVFSGLWMWCSCWMVLRGWDWRTTAGPRSSLIMWLAALPWPAARQTTGMPA